MYIYFKKICSKGGTKLLPYKRVNNESIIFRTLARNWSRWTRRIMEVSLEVCTTVDKSGSLMQAKMQVGPSGGS